MRSCAAPCGRFSSPNGTSTVDLRSFSTSNWRICWGSEIECRKSRGNTLG
jgi:hypothetical protein